MARFFIDRPIFAWVIAIVIMIAGALSITGLPVSQYPAIAPPAISIQTSYPGASATTLEETVTQVIEQRMSGLDGLRYISASSDATGGASVELTFEPGTDPDIAQVQVQNKLQLAMPQLPQEVQRQGVRVAKSNRNYLMIAAFVSVDGSMTRNDISDYVASVLQDPISRVPGVGDLQVFGSQYAMRIWLDPDKLNAFKLTPLDVTQAIQAQNAQVSAGQFGGTPSVPGQQLNATITAQSRLQTEEQFRDILLRVNESGAQVRLGDVSRVELTGESFEVESFIDRAPSAASASGSPSAPTRSTPRSGCAPGSPSSRPAFRRDSRCATGRLDAVRQDLDQGGGDHATRGDRPRVPRDAAVPPELPGDAHPHARRAGRVARHVRRAVAVRLQHQHADDVRHGARDRPPGRRRDRRWSRTSSA